MPIMQNWHLNYGSQYFFEFLQPEDVTERHNSLVSPFLSNVSKLRLLASETKSRKSLSVMNFQMGTKEGNDKS